jgi:hypothetical protein
MRFVTLVVLAAALSACGGGSAPDGSRTRFLLLAHMPIGGQLATAPDARLLDIGHQTCTKLDAHTSSDQIVSDLGGGEPGSAEFNAYSYVVIAAATELCPTHKGEFSGTGIPGS